MTRYGRQVLVLLSAAALAGCGADSGAGGGHACTEIGTPVGIGVDVREPPASTVDSASIEVCWQDSCRAPELTLRPSHGVASTTCTGSGCGAQAAPTGELHGFVTVPDLPASPVRVTLRLADQGGATVRTESVEVEPAMQYPNGPDCPGGGPQAGVVVDEGGMRPR
ncbi:hypothetical protein [Amycolatopsis cihanbeyliensis]|uniref:Lipoprotein n=1 Tax=Amycolatopsis cihanbeyliensis TaxID=1128664 RepID=A0A542CS91_AMYCI|nr:hypothetical protein [Amycolatopsis cihanbeyliensis]TQI93695.1 hypothetical protein FB471_5835 [Amycolatopsis cihanbeyliensis]